MNSRDKSIDAATPPPTPKQSCPDASGQAANAAGIPFEPGPLGMFANLPGIDPVMGLSYVGQKHELYGQLLVKFREGYGRSFVGNFQDFVAVANWVEARRLTHSLKSVARTLGAERLGELAWRLEELCLARIATADVAKVPATDHGKREVFESMTAVAAELACVVAGLEGVDHAAVEDDSGENVRDLIRRLAYLLQSRDTEANRFATPFYRVIEELGHADVAGKIARAIARYDYEQALANLHELARVLQIAIDYQ